MNSREELLSAVWIITDEVYILQQKDKLACHVRTDFTVFIQHLYGSQMVLKTLVSAAD